MKTLIVSILLFKRMVRIFAQALILKTVGNGVEITNITTACARDIEHSFNEPLVYPESYDKLREAIQEFSSRHNREIYPEQPLSGSKSSDNSSISKINEEKTTGNGVNYRVRDGHEAAVEDARRRLESDDASEFERQAARAVIKAYGGDDAPDGGNGGGPRFRMREPQKEIVDKWHNSQVFLGKNFLLARF